MPFFINDEPPKEKEKVAITHIEAENYWRIRAEFAESKLLADAYLVKMELSKKEFQLWTERNCSQPEIDSDKSLKCPQINK